MRRSKATATSRTSRACRTTCAMPCVSWTTAKSWPSTSTRCTSTCSWRARKASWPSSRTPSPTLSTTGTCIRSDGWCACGNGLARDIAIAGKPAPTAIALQILKGLAFSPTTAYSPASSHNHDKHSQRLGATLPVLKHRRPRLHRWSIPSGTQRRHLRMHQPG
ncbi:hypothetical protein EMIT0P176_100170 [Pseudomonas sp. IT-P176]